MLDAVLLVLREVLEAALFVSLLLALGAHLGLRTRWAAVALPLGVAGSFALSLAAYPIAEAFDGTGQEFLNAALYLVAIGCFVAIGTMSIRYALRNASPAAGPVGALPVLFIAIVACSMAREGSEVWLYLSAFRGNASLAPALLGGFVGFGIGLSVCALVYYVFCFLPPRKFFAVFHLLVALVIGGLSMQVAKQGLQAGWFSSGRAIWDSSWLVSERSWAGQLLHALFGYDANPDLTQAVFYFGALTLFGASLAWGVRRGGSHA